MLCNNAMSRGSLDKNAANIGGNFPGKVRIHQDVLKERIRNAVLKERVLKERIG